jgi:sensor histidine kinase YesM
MLLFFWGMVALLATGREAFGPHFGGESGLRAGEATYLLLVYTVWALVSPFVFWASARLFPDRIGWMRAVPLAAALGMMVAVVVDLVDHLLWNTFVESPIHRPISVRFVISNFHFLPEFFVYGAVLAAGYARAYFIRVQDHEREATQLRMDAARLQTHLAEARLQALRMQINPHFLFNTLHAVSDHFEEDPRTARRMLARLSEMLRYSFEGSDTREVPLSKELQFLDAYLDLQRIRFEDRLQVRFDIADEIREALVPTLILQPLVENAVIHGVGPSVAPVIIAVRAWREGPTLHLRVADNGPGSGQESNGSPASGGIGLHNTRERLETLYGTRQRFEAAPAPGGGFVAQLSIPFHTAADPVVASVEP